MPNPKLEEVFKRSGLPTYTFVEPVEYGHLKVALRTPGRGVVIEGPSGIGKTTAVRKASIEAGLGDRAQMLSGRNADDVEMIKLIPEIRDGGVIVIDDFHRLEDTIKHNIAEYLKIVADTEDAGTKLVLIGINKAGDSLIHFAADLNNRIDTIHFELNDVSKIRELVKKGEEALGVTIDCAQALAADASGSFHIAQILCHEVCVEAGVLEASDQKIRIEVGLERIKDRVLNELSRTFRARAVQFSRGKRFNRKGRAPYLHLLRYLIRSNEWTCNVDDVIKSDAKVRGSLGQVVDKGYLKRFLEENADLRDLFHYDDYTRVFAIEDPKLMYFLRNVLWSKFAVEVGFVSIEYRSKFDFALSFAGAQRELAAALSTALKDQDLEVFYDFDEQHNIAAVDVEQYLAPIYHSEARFVLALLSKDYPNRIWAKFESEQFKDRFGTGAVIPIHFSDAMPGMFDPMAKIGGYGLDVGKDINPQIASIVESLVTKVGEQRADEETQTKEREEAKEVIEET